MEKKIHFVTYKDVVSKGNPVLGAEAKVCGRSPAEIVGSNPNWVIDICLL